MDRIEIEFLPDGSFKMTTGRVSGANHGNAETLLREIATKAGGTMTRTRRLTVNAHLHEHDHAHTGHGHDHSH